MTLKCVYNSLQLILNYFSFLPMYLWFCTTEFMHLRMLNKNNLHIFNVDFFFRYFFFSAKLQWFIPNCCKNYLCRFFFVFQSHKGQTFRFQSAYTAKKKKKNPFPLDPLNNAWKKSKRIFRCQKVYNFSLYAKVHFCTVHIASNVCQRNFRISTHCSNARKKRKK